MNVVSFVVIVVAVVVVLFCFALIGYRYGWTNSGQSTPEKKDTEDTPRSKTLWDWMQLLLIPLTLAAAGGVIILFQHSHDDWIEDVRNQHETDLQNQRLQEDAWRAYLDRMSSLIANERGAALRTAPQNSDTRELARASTSAILARSDAIYKRKVLRFLDDSQLIQRSDVTKTLDPSGGPALTFSGEELKTPIVNLYGVDLRYADLEEQVLVGDDLRSVRLNNANLAEANLDYTTLVNADLSGANLSKAELKGADLSGANLTSVEGLTHEQLDQAWRDENTTLPEGF